MLRFIFILIFYLIYNISFGQCIGLSVNAGPDLFKCKLSDVLQLQGDVQGNYLKYYWEPASGLSNPNVLDPIVIAGPGKYRFKLVAEGLSTTNLITNGDFEGGYSGFSHQYIYGGPPFGPDHLVVDMMPNAYNSSWSPCGDHTSGSGNQLIADGSTSAGDAVWCQIVSVTPGNMYQFSFFAQSVFPVAPGQFSIEVDGTSIGNAIAGPLCGWSSFEACFTAKSANIEICIRETSGVGYGNDFGIDDITLFEKCRVEDEVEVEIVDLKAALDVVQLPKCASEEFTLDGSRSSSGPQINYEWSSSGGTITSISGNKAKGRGQGTYILKVTYTNGNVICEEEAEIQIDVSDDLIGDLTSSGIANCSHDTVYLAIYVLNGSGLYSYKWGPTKEIVGGQNTDTAKVINAGRYSVTVTDLSSGCEFYKDIDVKSDTTLPHSVIQGDTLINCKTKSVRLLSQQQDTSRYFYTWILPDNSVVFDETELLSGQSGKFRLIIQDKANNCSDSSDWDVQIDTTTSNIIWNGNLTIDCINEEVTLFPNVSPKTQSLNYSWTLPSGQLVSGDTLALIKTTSAGRFILTVSNIDNYCQDTMSFDVRDIRSIPMVDAGPDRVLTCKDNTVNLSGIVGPSNSITFDWRDSSGNSILPSNQLQPDVNVKGWYYLKVLDTSNHCESIDSVYVDENRKVPRSLITANDTVFACNDNSLVLDGAGSDSGPGILMSWSTVDGSILSGQTTMKLTIGSAGTYMLTVRDTINGCESSSIVTIVPDRNAPTGTASVSDTLNCKLQTVGLRGSAFNPAGHPMKYNWFSSQNHPIMNDTSLNATVTEPGLYELFIVDLFNGCTTRVQTTVSQDTVSPLPSIKGDTIWNCKTSALSLSGLTSMGSHQLNYKWSTTDGKFTGQGDRADLLIENYGTYKLVVEDQRNGCTAETSFTVKPDLNVPQLRLDQALSITCLRTTVVLTATVNQQGSANSKAWYTVLGNFVGSPLEDTVRVDKTGYYYYRFTNLDNDCSVVDSVLVTEDKTPPKGTAGSDGQLTCSVSEVHLNGNADPGTEVEWTTQDGVIEGDVNSLQVTAQKEGTYVLRISSLTNGCETTDTVKIIKNTNVPTASLHTLIQPNCPGDQGAIQIVGAEGGEAPYRYYVDQRETDGIFPFQVNSGDHEIRIIDANGCDWVEKFKIVEPQAISVELPVEVTLQLGSDYDIVPDYSVPDDSIAWVRWTPAEGLSCGDCPYPTLKNFSREQSYTISYVDKRGCEARAEIRFVKAERGVWLPNAFSPNGDGINEYFFPSITPSAASEISEFSIYDRWGELVYFRENIPPEDNTQGWNGVWRGENASTGVYVYVLKLRWKDETTEIFSGDMTLFR